MNILPINLNDLIHGRSIESIRREFKKTWSKPTLIQVVHTICAFANDFYNLNGGYIIVGIEEKNGLPVLPPFGLDGQDLDRIQKEIRGQCRRIDPEYQPILSPEIFQDKQILVIWAPGGDVRPYQAPMDENSGHRAYYVRQGSETVAAKGEILTQLMQMAARVPFDDRRNLSAPIEAVSPVLVRRFLMDIKSDLARPGATISDQELYRAMRISEPVNSHEAPKNVALLFFAEDPERYFPGARIEVVQFGDDAGGDLIEEKIFRGPVHFQIRQVLDYLNSLSTSIVQKIPNQAESLRTVAFPYEAMEEALVNAVYHRSYDATQEPVKVYLYPDRMEIISYPGPVPGIEPGHFLPGSMVPPVPVRNRRIGEFLKELHLAEGRGTGIPKIYRKMNENGSPEPSFQFNRERTYFQVTLPAHPQYIVINALRESAHLWAIGERKKSLSLLESAEARVPNSGALLAQLVEYHISLGNMAEAERIFKVKADDERVVDRHLLYMAMAKAYLDKQNPKMAAAILARMPDPGKVKDQVELAVLYKRAKQYQSAHAIFSAYYDVLKDDPRAVHEYAQTKLKLAAQARGNPFSRERLDREAVELLRRAIQLSNDEVRKAWCWFDLAKTLNWLKASETEVEQAYLRALEILPDESRFQEAYSRWRQNLE
jgi:ATP-dependent DNA helicase RecG